MDTWVGQFFLPKLVPVTYDTIDSVTKIAVLCNDTLVSSGGACAASPGVTWGHIRT